MPQAGFGSPHPAVGRGVLSTRYPLPIPNPKPSPNLLLFPLLGLPRAQGLTFPPRRGKISSVPRLQASFCPPRAADHQGCAPPLSPTLQNLLRTAATATQLFPFERINKPQKKPVSLCFPTPPPAPTPRGWELAEEPPSSAPTSPRAPEQTNRIPPPCETSRVFETLPLSIPLFCLRRGGCVRAEAPGDVKGDVRGWPGFSAPVLPLFSWRPPGTRALVFPLPPRKPVAPTPKLAPWTASPFRRGSPKPRSPPLGAQPRAPHPFPRVGSGGGSAAPRRAARPPHGAPEALVWLRGCSP